MLLIDEIYKSLPHRFPFLMVDRIVSVEKEKSVIGLKNVTVNEPYFQGHFPDEPLMPAVMIIEAMSQVGGFIFAADGFPPSDYLLHPCFLYLDGCFYTTYLP